MPGSMPRWADHPAPVQFGAMYLHGGEDRRSTTERFTVIDFARAAEQAGFDSVWTGDHPLSHVDGFAAAGAMLAATERVAVGTNVVVLPMRPAAVTAKAAATIAAMAGDRHTYLGVGVGGDVPADFQVTGAELRTRGAYADEALNVIRRLWAGNRVTYSGRWNDFANVMMTGLPRVAPSILVGGRSDAAIRRACVHGDGLIPYLVSPAQASGHFDSVAHQARLHGRDPAELLLAVTTFLVPGRTAAHAIELARAATPPSGRGGFRGITESVMARAYVLGSASECVDRLRDYVRTGARLIVLGAQRGPADVLAEFMTMAQEILPKLRAEIADGLGRGERACRHT